MWVKSENNEAVRPEALEYSGNNVIIRRNYRMIEATDDRPAHYVYDEWQMTAAQYEVYKAFEAQTAEQSDALVELAALYAEQDDALVELAEIIMEGME